MKTFLLILLWLGAAWLQIAAAQADRKPATDTAAKQTAKKPAVHDSDLNWALELEKQNKAGYKPTQAELDRYTDIYNRLISEGADSNHVNPQTAPAAVHDSDLNWAIELQKQIMAGYKPTQAETDRYTDIFNRYTEGIDSIFAKQQTGPAAVHDSDLNWAMELQKQITAGYKPTQAETDRYTDIYNRYMQEKADSSQATEKPSPEPAVTQQELQWALNLEQKVKAGYPPTKEETAMYEDIAQRLQNTQPKQAAVSYAEEVNWALKWLQKKATGYVPSAAEQALFDKYYRNPDFQRELVSEAQKRNILIPKD